MRFTLPTLAFGIAILSPFSSATAAPVPDFRAVYRSVDGTEGSIAVSSSYDSGADIHTLIVRSVSDDGRRYVRTLRFKLDDERVRPLTYRQDDPRCTSCTVKATFDWDRRVLQYETRGMQRIASAAERDGTPSRLARDVAMLVALLPGRRDVTGFDGALAGTSLGTAELETPLGTVTADGRAHQGTWRQSVWLAREVDLLPVRVHAFGATVELSELAGIERSTDARAAVPGDRAVATAAALALPEYRAVYRVDAARKADVARFEVALRRDGAADRYELVVSIVENTRRKDTVTEIISFRVIGDSAYPLSLRMEGRGGRSLLDATFDWSLLEALVRLGGRQERYLLVEFDDLAESDGTSVPVWVLEPLAVSLALLPGGLSVAGFSDVLTAQPQGASEVELPIGSFAVERTVLVGQDEDANGEIWRAGALANLPVRLSGTLMMTKGATMQLVELSGIERAGTN